MTLPGKHAELVHQQSCWLVLRSGDDIFQSCAAFRASQKGQRLPANPGASQWQGRAPARLRQCESGPHWRCAGRTTNSCASRCEVRQDSSESLPLCGLEDHAPSMCWVWLSHFYLGASSVLAFRHKSTGPSSRKVERVVFLRRGSLKTVVEAA